MGQVETSTEARDLHGGQGEISTAVMGQVETSTVTMGYTENMEILVLQSWAR